MDQSTQNEMREVIQEKIEETEKEIAQLEELTKPIEPDNAYGRLSRMDAINNKTIRLGQTYCLEFWINLPVKCTGFV